MLESMVVAPRPTRAEASDVANAIFDGADAILLSAETAIGANPVLAVEAAARIAVECDERGCGLPVARRAAQRPRPMPTRWPMPRSPSPAPRPTSPRSRATRAAAERRGSSAHCGRASRSWPSRPDPRRRRRARRSCTACIARACRGGGRCRGSPSCPGSWRLSRALPAGSAVVLVASTAAPGSGPNLLEVARVLRAQLLAGLYEPGSVIPPSHASQSAARPDPSRPAPTPSATSTRALRLASVPEKIAPASHHSERAAGEARSPAGPGPRGSGSSARPGPIAP